MIEPARLRDIENPKARRKAAMARTGEYHEQQLRLLLEHVREGFARMDADEVDPFELDELNHHYERASQKLWSFCCGTGSSLERAALTLEFWSETGEPEPGWWEAGAACRRR